MPWHKITWYQTRTDPRHISFLDNDETHFLHFIKIYHIILLIIKQLKTNAS